MLSKIKEKLEKHKKDTKKEKVDTRSILILILFFVLAILSYLLTRKTIFFLGCMVLGLSVSISLSDGLLPERKKEELKKDYRDNITFFSLFYHYSYLFNSYQEGFLAAHEKLRLCHQKDIISDYLENPKEGLMLNVTNSRCEHALLCLIHRYFHSDEETGKEELSHLYALLRRYQKEFDGK